MGRPVVHFDIGCRDAEATSRFYAELFGWRVEDYFPSSKRLVTGAEEGLSSGTCTALGHEPHQYVMIYVEVDDVQASAERAVELGATVLIPETQVPEQGWFAWMQDPAGNRFGLWKPLRGEGGDPQPPSGP